MCRQALPAIYEREGVRASFQIGEYWETGGFPEAAGLGRNLRIKTHQEE
jgi:hypothetical protein